MAGDSIITISDDDGDAERPTLPHANCSAQETTTVATMVNATAASATLEGARHCDLDQMVTAPPPPPPAAATATFGFLS